MRSCIKLYRCFKPAVRTPQHHRHSSFLSRGESSNRCSGPSSKAVIRGSTQAFSNNASVRISATEQTKTSSVSRNGARSQFVPRKKIRSIKEEGEKLLDQEIHVSGWVRTVRNQKSFSFLEVNDGSSVQGLQIVVNKDAIGYADLEGGRINTGAAVQATGVLVKSPGGKQSVELKAKEVNLIGGCDAEKYPLQKKRHTLEFLRSIAHLRPRTNTIGAAARVRSALSHATHLFFQDSGFLYLHTPILSAADCEGAGELFQVGEKETVSEGEVQKLKEQAEEQGKKVSAMKAAAKEDPSYTKQAIKEEVDKLLRLKAEAETAAESLQSPSGLPTRPDGQTDYTKDFFGREAFLSVSGQLNAEAYACALSDVYTFGPTFRAENSNTGRHLAEFWMIEPEIAFADLSRVISLAESYLKYCLQYVLQNCREDLKFFQQQYDSTLLERLQAMVDNPFAVITYSEAVELLKKSGRKFEFPVDYGTDLQSEHERYLTEVEFKGVPLFVTNYPKEFKAFYMRLNDDNKTVAAMDLLVPGVGELIGGSQREERIEVLESRMTDLSLDPEPYWWYLDLRKYGSVPHAGFGLGLERLVQFVTGLDNIRDVIAFPRYPGHCNF